MLETTFSVPLPDFKIETEIPSVKIESIRLQKFKAFEDYSINFLSNGECKPFVCFIGSNGCGKSTILDVIQLVFGQFEAYDKNRLKLILGKAVRDANHQSVGLYTDADFLITANLLTSEGDYQVQINKEGFVKDHPPEIKQYVRRLCANTKFDRTLDQFQLVRDKWEQFAEAFQTVTGFEIKEKTTSFDVSSDPRAAQLLDDYVLGFTVEKPDETISHKECSAGEKKIIKSFSALLNEEFTPSVILIDNVEMHIESGRHLFLIEALRNCFSSSQIFVTTHSYQISQNFSERSQIYDLRMIKATQLVISEPWRLYVSDEIRDQLVKLKSMQTEEIEETEECILYGENLLNHCQLSSSIDLKSIKHFFSKSFDLYINNLTSKFPKEI